ncbi:MAG TPA: endonuclease domain-containing protein [Tepidisphaeraceae bacterium]
MSKRYRPPKPLREMLSCRAKDLRREMAPAERQLWMHLRNDQMMGLRFRRQFRIEMYIVDFYCPSRKLVVEVDGDSHSEREEYDARRTERMNALGLRVIRFTNSNVASNIEGVLSAIAEACGQERL